MANLITRGLGNNSLIITRGMGIGAVVSTPTRSCTRDTRARYNWGSQDAVYFRALEAERIEQTGVTAEYYSLNRGTNVDALYGEPDNDPLYGGSSMAGTPQVHDLSWNFCPDVEGGEDSLIIPCAMEYVEFDNSNPMVRGEGQMTEYDAVMIVSYNHWQCCVTESSLVCLQDRLPKEGDVCYVFDEWFDIVKVGESGNILATEEVVGYRFELRERTQFTPDRKIS